LKEQVAELLKVNAELPEKVAKLSKNSSNSSKPPSSDIVKPPEAKQADGPRRQGGQSLFPSTLADKVWAPFVSAFLFNLISCIKHLATPLRLISNRISSLP